MATPARAPLRNLIPHPHSQIISTVVEILHRLLPNALRQKRHLLLEQILRSDPYGRFIPLWELEEVGEERFAEGFGCFSGDEGREVVCGLGGGCVSMRGLGGGMRNIFQKGLRI